MDKKKYIVLKDLEVYQLARKLSDIALQSYEGLNWQDKKIMGDQFIDSSDSVGANIAEGYKRYHYLDKIKFYYTSRASLSESSDHWLELLYERGKMKKKDFDAIKEIATKLSVKLNNLIDATYNLKNNE